MRPPASLLQLRDGAIEPLLVVVDGDDDGALARHDVGGGAAVPLAAAVISATLS